MNAQRMREKGGRRTLGVLYEDVSRSKVLLVGAGGIGCELLKNLAMNNFGEIHVIDLDTIDLSNLNRQFLFGHEHIKRSKALVAREVASQFNPRITIEAYHANIKDPQFGLHWFRGFNVVFNALDNLDARRHVNKMCLAADVPLIESGTTGFNGQVQVIKQGVSECYDCNPKETPKTFPVCTIRSTPSQPIHCIVWAKSYLFAEIFGVSEDESPDLDTTEDLENAKEIKKLREEASALKRIRESMGSEDFPRMVFEKVFVQDIERLRDMEDMWKNRKKPDLMNFNHLKQQAMDVDGMTGDRDQAVWTPAENFAVFSRSLKKLSDRLEELRATTDIGNTAPVLSFDKDDKDTLDFVASAANLRSLTFHIEPKSEFEIKQMAGNIIPAIATTNAMTASMCVLQAFKVLRRAKNENNGPSAEPGDYGKARMQFLSRSTERLISSEPLRPPRSDCAVCGVCQAVINLDIERATLKDFTDGILKDQLGYSDEFSVTTKQGLIFDPDLEDNLEKKLSTLNVRQDTFLTVVDEDDDPRVNVHFAVVEDQIPVEDAPIKIPKAVKIARKAQRPEPVVNGHVNGVEPLAAVNGSASKRKRNADEPDLEADIQSKKGKVAGERPTKPSNMDDDEIQMIDDSADGAIVIDD